MPDTDKDGFSSILLDLALGQLSGEDRRAAEAQLADDPQLRAEQINVKDVVSALASWKVAAPSELAARMVESVRARIAATPRIVPAAVRRTRITSEPVVLRMGNLRDIIAVAAVVVLAVGLGVPGVLNMKARNQRLMCGQNLATLGRGVQQYTSAYASALPFAGWRDGSSWLPDTSRAGGAALPNRQHMYPLLQAAVVADPRLFICPSQHDVPLSNADVRRFGSFPEARNVSYAYYNMAGLRPSASAPSRLPILSDDNPLFTDGVPLQDLRAWLQGDASRVNSQAHRGVGQNVLSLDGHVEFAKTPLVGIDGDNIWTLQGVGAYTGREGPQTTTDAHLLK